jgi:transcriptional repressor NrdR
MHCPFCKRQETQVRDSRILDEGGTVKRRRHCLSCDSRFTTFERVQLREVVVLKKNGDKKLFDQEKLRRSIEMAVRKRPISDIEVRNMVSEIVHKVESSGEGEITSAIIGEYVMGALGRIDKVALVRFSSVYKNFEQTDDFLEFVKKI